MSALSGRVATFLALNTLIVTAGCAEGKSIPLPKFIKQAVHSELQPIISLLQSGQEQLEIRLESRTEALERGMESRLESIEDRLTLLNSRMEELTGRLDGQQTQLDEVITQLIGQNSQHDEKTVTGNEHTEQLRAIAITMEKYNTEMRKLATRLDSQQSQLNKLSSLLSEQKTMDGDVAVTMNNDTVKQKHPRDCSDLPAGSPSGVYLIRPSVDSQQPYVEAFCDMETAEGNWTVIQRRDDIQPRQNFFLGWSAYKKGFGNETQEFWWGLEKIRQLTSSKDRRYELRIDLEAFNGRQAYALYQGFAISSELDGYRLRISNYSGNAGDGLQYGVNEKFSTYDRDQDGSSYYNCAQRVQGAWWFGRVCGYSTMNGPHQDSRSSDWAGIWWVMWRGLDSPKKTEMKIRPTAQHR
ncbi:Techylectin-5B [Amphibalanus amphitrite]|uniref:Techylectin-5B n=1 Tax=Amphibalanus amphitrite TaxID=1232801 RepID=A0A6A4X916_AMPAM|nr:Techylectin-5B [Amphibalanus amphitrite]